MIARSLQSVLDANAVHLEATVSGTIPGALLGRPEERVVLDGTTVQADIRPRDARTAASVDSPPLDVALETVTVWDGAWYRTSPGRAVVQGIAGRRGGRRGHRRQPAHAGGPAARLARRSRTWTPSSPTSRARASPAPAATSCWRRARTRPTSWARCSPTAASRRLPEVATTITLDADARTLRPAHLELDMRSEDGSVDLRVALDASRWDDPGIVIEEPPSGS